MSDVLEKPKLDGPGMDFDIVHCFCPECYPEIYNQRDCPGIGSVQIAICGYEEPHRHGKNWPADEDGIPLNPCPECLRLVAAGKSLTCDH